MIKYEPKPNKNIINSEMLQEYLKDNDKRILVRSIANDKTLNLTFKSDDIVLDRYCDLSKISFPLLRQRNSEDPEVTDFTTCLDEIYANPKKAETQSKIKQDEEDEENKYLNLRKVQKIFSKFKFEFFKKFPELKTIIKEVHLKLLEFKDTNSNNYERIYFTLKFSLHDTDDRRNKDNKNNNSKNNEKDGDKNGLTHEKEERIKSKI
ncbi:unnamed protein product [[Candida] boidinii]|nr:unnamed protein product [[Candida] boidinii]